MAPKCVEKSKIVENDEDEEVIKTNLESHRSKQSLLQYGKLKHYKMSS